jgi:pimeloyl-ACP methyl ester carboxylesterase
MATFALMHGANHGASCWDFFMPELRSRGHDAVAMDLPIEDPSAGISRYTEAVIEAIGSREDVVVVAHSLAGIVAPVVATLRPIRRIIFLAAIVPELGTSVAEQLARTSISKPRTRIDNGDGTFTQPVDEAEERYYHDVEPTRRRWALDRLRRQALTAQGEVSPLAAWPNVACSYIVCSDDRALEPEACRRMARDLLSVEPIEFPSSHAPMLSRPAELADLAVSLL